MATLQPLLIFGDGPRVNSGLARIARDVTVRLVANSEALGLQIAQVGVDDPGGRAWQSWDTYGFQPHRGDYGRQMVAQAGRDLVAETGQEAIVLAMTDPGRVFDLTREPYDRDDDPRLDLPVWGYLPIDATGPRGTIGGPALASLCAMTRVLGYGRWGAQVLSASLHEARARGKELASQEADQPIRVPYLPHGLDLDTWKPTAPGADDRGFWTWYDKRRAADALIVGAVATNQPRKDLGLLFAAMAELKVRGVPVGLWLVTDMATNAWDVGELAFQFAFTKAEVHLTITTQEGALTDAALAARYSQSHCTVAPGLGEGFGYPIVESLACGTPVVHGNYGGGVELVPAARWLFQPVAWRLESIYALQRPVYHPTDVATAILRTQDQGPIGVSPTQRAYCTGSVHHLSWRTLWPAWEQWIRQGLTRTGRRG